MAKRILLLILLIACNNGLDKDELKTCLVESFTGDVKIYGKYGGIHKPRISIEIMDEFGFNICSTVVHDLNTNRTSDDFEIDSVFYTLGTDVRPIILRFTNQSSVLHNARLNIEMLTESTRLTGNPLRFLDNGESLEILIK